jgi:Lon protease-like protein
MSHLPLFPLPLVLLPGMRMPLYIFEPRYRRMLRSALAGDRSFGLIYRDADTPEEDLAAGTILCRALISDVEELADGRSNITVTGGERFSLVRLVETGTPYLVGEVEPFADEREPVAQVTALALRLREIFAEAAHAARALSDELAEVPALPDDPGQIAFAAAASIDLLRADRQRLLASSSPSGRMRTVIALLDASLPALRRRVGVHEQAKSNGHGPIEIGRASCRERV